MITFNTTVSPKMPKLGKGLECIKLLTSQISPDMRESIVPMVFPALASFVTETEFQYISNKWFELSGMMAHLVADSGMGKGQLTDCVETIMQKFAMHDADELQKLVNWQKAVKSKAANKEKPVRPDVAFWFPPSDVTNPAFIQNAMACEKGGNHSQYYNMPEIEMADQLCGSHRKVSKMIRKIFDCEKDGALRATADGVVGNPKIRTNITFSSTPFAARKFYKSELFNGTFGRIAFSYKAREDRNGKVPRQGSYDEAFCEKLNEYIVRLESCKGRFDAPQLNKLAEKLAADMAMIADLADDDNLWDMGKRAIVMAWKNGCLLYILNGQQWTRAMGDLVEWMVYHDLWSKFQVFNDLLKDCDGGISSENKGGPKNMLDDLPDSFTEAQLEALRQSLGKGTGANRQIRVWKARGFITFNDATGLFSKTEKYFNRLK